MTFSAMTFKTILKMSGPFSKVKDTDCTQTVNELIKRLNSDEQCDSLLLDIYKAFDQVSHTWYCTN